MAERRSTRVAEPDTLPRLVAEVVRLWRMALNERLRPLGLSDAKWRALMYIARSATEPSQAALAAQLGIEAPTLVRLLDRLAADGWIERVSAPADRRVKRIRLLPKAEKVIGAIERTASEVRAEMLAGISRAELQACQRTLEKIRARVDATVRGGRARHGTARGN